MLAQTICILFHIAICGLGLDLGLEHVGLGLGLANTGLGLNYKTAVILTLVLFTSDMDGK